MSKLSKLRAAVMTLFRDRRNKRDRSLEIGSVRLPRVVFSCRKHEYFFATLPRAPGAATALAKVTGVIATARVRLRVAAGCEAPPVGPAQRKFFRCLGVKRPVS